MFRIFRQLSSAPPRRASHREARRPTCRPWAEELEDRDVPATFNVAAGDVAGLYAALNAANANGQEDTVNLAPGAAYNLTGPGIVLNGDATGVALAADGGQRLTLNGNGATIALAVGASQFRLLSVSNGAAVTLSRLILRNGHAGNGYGGGISNYGTLRLEGCVVSDNKAHGGGGIFNGGTLTVANSTLARNAAPGIDGIGGAIENLGTLEVNNSTLSGNSAVSGGGISNYGVATLTNATVTANKSVFGGAIEVILTSMVRLRNTIVAGNVRTTGDPGADVTGELHDSAFNLIGDGTGLIGISNNDDNGNLVGVDPMLGPLQDNGGPTPTHALLPGSPARDHGLHFAASGTDQRGFGRYGAPDIGAFEYVPPPAPRSLVASMVAVKQGRKHRLKVVVRYADTDEVKARFFSPFNKPAYRGITALAIDTNGDGAIDAVQVTALKTGFRKKTVTRIIAI